MVQTHQANIRRFFQNIQLDEGYDTLITQYYEDITHPLFKGFRTRNFRNIFKKIKILRLKYI